MHCRIESSNDTTEIQCGRKHVRRQRDYVWAADDSPLRRGARSYDRCIIRQAGGDQPASTRPLAPTGQTSDGDGPAAEDVANFLWLLDDELTTIVDEMKYVQKLLNGNATEEDDEDTDGA